mgnify:CR=1 FL=1
MKKWTGDDKVAEMTRKNTVIIIKRILKKIRRKKTESKSKFISRTSPETAKNLDF